MKEATLNQLKLVIGQMETLQAQHPKARVLFEFESNRILITYPLPEDFYTIKGLKIINEYLTRAGSSLWE